MNTHRARVAVSLGTCDQDQFLLMIKSRALLKSAESGIFSFAKPGPLRISGEGALEFVRMELQFTCFPTTAASR